MPCKLLINKHSINTVNTASTASTAYTAYTASATLEQKGLQAYGANLHANQKALHTNILCFGLQAQKGVT